MDVGIGEAGDDDTTAEVDDLGRRERGLVNPDPAGDAVAREGERPLGWNLRVERPDEAVLEDHAAQCSTLPRHGRPERSRVQPPGPGEGRGMKGEAMKRSAISRLLIVGSMVLTVAALSATAA